VRPLLTTLIVALLSACSDNARLLDASVDLPLPLDDAPLEEPAADAPDAVALDAIAVDVADVPSLDVESPARPFGATVDDGGVTFRVWAPGAMSAQVSGDFGDHELLSEDGGVFAARVAGARAGQGYRFVLRRGGPDAQPRRSEGARHVRRRGGGARPGHLPLAHGPLHPACGGARR
jgi:hypothetical protein